jgi:hypothetical protein
MSALSASSTIARWRVHRPLAMRINSSRYFPRRSEDKPSGSLRVGSVLVRVALAARLVNDDRSWRRHLFGWHCQVIVRAYGLPGGMCCFRRMLIEGAGFGFGLRARIDTTRTVRAVVHPALCAILRAFLNRRRPGRRARKTVRARGTVHSDHGGTCGALCHRTGWIG